MNNMYYYFGYINISFDKRIIKIYKLDAITDYY